MDVVLVMEREFVIRIVIVDILGDGGIIKGFCGSLLLRLVIDVVCVVVCWCFLFDC